MSLRDSAHWPGDPIRRLTKQFIHHLTPVNDRRRAAIAGGEACFRVDAEGVVDRGGEVCRGVGQRDGIGGVGFAVDCAAVESTEPTEDTDLEPPQAPEKVDVDPSADDAEIAERLRSILEPADRFLDQWETHSMLKVRSSVIRQIKGAFDQAGISMPDEAREVIFPKDVPVRMVSDQATSENGQPRSITTLPAATEYQPESEEVSTAAEGGLASEADEIREPARRSGTLDEGANLLEETPAS